MATDGQLERLQQHLTERNRGEGHDIIEAHRLMLKSPELVGETRRLIREECLGAEWAVRRTLDGIHAAFAGLEDAYIVVQTETSVSGYVRKLTGRSPWPRGRHAPQARA